MRARSSGLHPKKGTIARMRKQIISLKREGITNRKERRRHISSKEVEFWEKRAEDWNPSTFALGGSKGYQAQRKRTINKIGKLLEKIENAKTSIERRKVIAEMRTIRFPSVKIGDKIPIEKKIHLSTMRIALIDKLKEIIQNTKLPADERIEATRALVNVSGPVAPAALAELVEKNPENYAVKREAERILSKSINGTTLALIEKRLIKSDNMHTTLFGLNVLANMPSILAITKLAKIMGYPKMQIYDVPKKVKPMERTAIQKIISDRATMERLTEYSRKFFRKLLLESDKKMSRKFDLYSNIFLVGMTARAIRQWFQRFEKKVGVPKEFRAGLLDMLQARRENLVEISRNIGEPTALKFAIKNIDFAIEQIQTGR